jgi:hypothetical protein
MKRHLLPVTALTAVLVLVLFAPAIAFCQVHSPESGALLSITGTVGNTPVNVKIYDSQIHSGAILRPPTSGLTNCIPQDQIPTDAYVLQGGAPTGCDPGDAWEVTDNNPNTFHQSAGKADIGGFHIETHYLCGGTCDGGLSGDLVCNTNGTICAAPDSGFLTVTNTGNASFTGTITLTGTSPIAGPPYCPVGGVASDSWTSGLVTGQAVILALGTPGTDGFNTSDSSNCGGFNAGQTQTLVAGATNTFLIGNDDYLFSPVNSAAGDQLTVTPIPVPAGPLGLPAFGGGSNFGSEIPVFSALRFAAPSFPNEACIPYADFSAPLNPVCVELQLVCTPGNPNANDCNNFVYTAQTDYTVDTGSFPPPSDLIGGPAFLGDHNDNCFTTGFTFNSFLSFTAGIDPPLTKGGGKGNSCFAATFDPSQPSIPAGTTVSSFSGFEGLVSDTKINPIANQGLIPEVLIWDSNDINSGKPIPNLHLCKNTTGNGCTAPWVNLGLVPIANCPAGFGVDPLPSWLNLGLLHGDEVGEYVFPWSTFTKGVNLKGCIVSVVLQFDTTLTVAPATFQYKF